MRVCHLQKPPFFVSKPRAVIENIIRAEQILLVHLRMTVPGPAYSVRIRRPNRRANGIMISIESGCANTPTRTRLSFASRPLASRSTSPGQVSGQRSSGLPTICSTRKPAASKAAIAASLCAGLRVLWQASNKLVTPASKHDSAVSRVARPSFRRVKASQCLRDRGHIVADCVDVRHQSTQ